MCTWKVHEGRCKKRCKFSLCHKKLNVPVWVASSCNSEPSRTDLPRFQESPKVAPGRARPGLLRQHLQSHRLSDDQKDHAWNTTGGMCACGWTSRCMVPRAVYACHEKILEGLHAATRFVKQLLSEFQLLTGRVGVNDGMALLLTSLHECFCWDQLVIKQPTQRQIAAFVQSWKLLKPFLSKTAWPDREIFPLRYYSWELDEKDTVQGSGLRFRV